MLKFVIVGLSAWLLVACGATGPDSLPTPPNETGESSQQAEDQDLVDNDRTFTVPEYTRIRFGLKSRDEEPAAADKKRCTDAGGRVQRVGLRGVYECVQTYPDAGKVCRDSSECLGDCRTTDAEAIGNPGTGTCQQVDVPFGCYAQVRNGVVDGGMLCVD